MSKYQGDNKALMVVLNWSAGNVTVDLTSVTPDFPDTGKVEASTLRKEREARVQAWVCHVFSDNSLIPWEE